MKRFSHAFEIAFEVDSDSEKAEDVTTEELLAGLRRRAANLTANGNEIREAVSNFGDDPIDRVEEAADAAKSSTRRRPLLGASNH